MNNYVNRKLVNLDIVSLAYCKSYDNTALKNPKY